MLSIRSVLSKEQLELFNRERAARLVAGGAAFHHPLTVHGSHQNRSSQARRAAVVNLFLDGTRSNSEEVLLEGLPLFAKGEKLQGKFFPLLI